MNKNSHITASSIRAIIFDLGGVLVNVDFNGGFFPLLKSSLQGQHNDSAAAVYGNELFRRFNTGQLSARQFYEQVNTAFNLGLAFPAFKRQWCQVFSPMPGMAELVTTLSEKYVLGLLSDTDELHWEYCRRLFPFLKIFRKPTLSYKIGRLKPERECFRAAAENVHAPAEQCLFIDDRIVNVEGALAAGMNAIHFTDSGLLLRELEASGLL